MKCQFELDGIKFSGLDSKFIRPIAQYLAATSGAFLVPSENWKNELGNLPSPLQSPDALALLITGNMPTTTATLTGTYLDVIRQESRPMTGEGPLNIYRQYIMKMTNGAYFISEPTKPDHHWANTAMALDIYGIQSFFR